MRKGLLYLITFLYCSFTLYGQYSSSDTLFTINNKAFPSEPFNELYKSAKLIDKNNNALNYTEALNLYIEFHLKATEAKKLNIDTLPQVIEEIEICKDHAFKNYLYPTKITDQLLAETFNRIQLYLNLSHILIKIEGRETPKDTLEAYNKAYQVYEQLQTGKKFSKLAIQYSDDLLVRKNNGELGYITVFDMDYQFESAAYNLPVGSFSKPVRSSFGYHIIYKNEEIKNPGKVKIRHLMLEFKEKQNNEKLKLKADSIYQLLKNGNNFTEIILKHSNDVNSLQDNGELPWFGLFETTPEIEKAAFELKNKGDYSKLIKTDFGYHIIQLLDKKEYHSLEECKDDLIGLLHGDTRSSISEAELIKQLKKEYHFTENKKLLSNFYSILDYAYAELWEALFTIDGKSYSQEEFAIFMAKQASKDIYENFEDYINRLYVDFSKDRILNHHKNQLIQSYPDLKSLLEECENNVLVYYITKEIIWNKISEDNLEVFEFYKQNKDKYGAIEYDKIKDKVLNDYRSNLEYNWIIDLKSKYSVTINPKHN